MPSVPTRFPQNALHNAMKLLKEAAGDDPIVSRKDAKVLVEDLNATGQAATAEAVQHLFQLADGLDSKKGARVTGHKLDTIEGFVNRFLIEQEDKGDKGVLSPKDQKRMHAAGKALVDLGKVMSLQGKRGRVSHRVVDKGLNHLTALLDKASGGDHVTSRAEAKDLINDLRSQGRHSEAAAVDAFFAMADDLENLKGERVKTRDLPIIAELVGEQIHNADANHNGFSKAEIGGMPAELKAIFLVGQMADAGLLDAA